MSVPLEELTRPDRWPSTLIIALKLASPVHHRSTADKPTERAFFDIARESFALGHRAALGRRRFGGRFCFNTCSLIGGVGFGSGVVRNLRFVAGVVVIFLFLGILSILSISYLRNMGARMFSHRLSEP